MEFFRRKDLLSFIFSLELVVMCLSQVSTAVLPFPTTDPENLDLLFGPAMEAELRPSDYPPISIADKIRRGPVKPAPTINLSPSAREAYFLEDMRLSEFTNPNIFYLHSDEMEIYDLTGNQSLVPSEHSEHREAGVLARNSVPTYHDPNWESVQEVLNDMLFIGAWTDEEKIPKPKVDSPNDNEEKTVQQKRRPRRKTADVVLSPQLRKRRIVHDEN